MPASCITCGHPASEEDQFCSACGEKLRVEKNYSIWRFSLQALGGLFRVDNKSLRSLKTLILQPGKLSEDFFRGKRKPYLRPLQLFIFANLIFFLLPLDTLNYPLWTHVKVMQPAAYRTHAESLLENTMSIRGEDFQGFSNY